MPTFLLYCKPEQDWRRGENQSVFIQQQRTLATWTIYQCLSYDEDDALAAR